MNSHKLDERKLILVRVVQFVWARNRVRRSLLTALFSLVVLLALAAPSFAQSVLTDDAHTSSTAPKSFDANFGTNPNLNVSAGNVGALDDVARLAREWFVCYLFNKEERPIGAKTSSGSASR